MNSRERVLTAFAHQEPDRVPIDYSANTEIDHRVKAHYGLKADDHDGLRQALGVDFRRMDAPYKGPELHEEIPERGVNAWGVRTRWIEHESGGYWDYCDFPLRDATLEQVMAWPMPSPDHFDYEHVKTFCRQFDDYCLMAGGPGTVDIINQTGMIRTMEQVLVDLVTDDPAGLALIDRRLDIQLEILRRTLEAAGGRFDIVYLGEDLGTQRGPTISLELFRKHLRPRHQRFVDLAKAYGIGVMIHSCGSSSWAFDDFLEMGITVVDTLQPEARDMAPEYLKKRYGGQLCFHGMISTAGPVAYGTVADTVENVRRTLEIMKPGGGYALAPTHSLQSNSPTENVVAMYEAVRKHGAY
jgi:uroporphyrinogen decarboxylase